MAVTVGEIRRAVAELGEHRWEVRDDLPDEAPVRWNGTGGDLSRAIPAARVAALDLAKTVPARLTNPLLLQRRARLGLIDAPVAKVRHVGTMMVEAGRTRPAAVDWRNRWGVPWLATIQNQNPCQSCWAFAAAALVETMVRIEHGAWAKRSEGDLRDGWGVAEQNWQMRDNVLPCEHGAGENDALDFIVRKGIADPGSYPWYDTDHAYTPTADRDGRTVKVARYETIGDIEQQKQWLDAVGPLAASFTAYDDFQAYGGGIYRKSAYEELFSEGRSHIVLVVGYDDTQGCWIIRNSWGPGWGDAGYGLIAYGEVGIDDNAKYGIHGTNPDPWTRRRLHNGCVLESGNGPSHRNFEMLHRSVPRITHVWRAGGDGGDFSWHVAGDLEDPNDLGAGAASVGHPTLVSTTYGRNFECVYWEASGHLRHWWFDQQSQRWMNGGRFGPSDVEGYPGLIQGNYGAPGNFEVVVRTRDRRLNHWWRENSAPFAWHDGGRFAQGVRQSGPALVQSKLGSRGNFDLVCVLDNGRMQHWWRDNDAEGGWKAGTAFGSGIGDTPPVMIEGTFGASDERIPGNFELCVAVGGRVQHWWRNNHLPERTQLMRPLVGGSDWTFGVAFGHDVKHVWGLLQGSFAFNLEAIVERTDGVLQHYWRDNDGWHEGELIQPI